MAKGTSGQRDGAHHLRSRADADRGAQIVRDARELRGFSAGRLLSTPRRWVAIWRPRSGHRVNAPAGFVSMFASEH